MPDAVSRGFRVGVVTRCEGAIPDETECRRFLEAASSALGIGDGEVSVLICDDDEMASLNRRFRDRRGPTDVLSFPAGPEGAGFIGDIAVSAQTAARQARAAGRGVREEILTLLAHGFLHLLGYDHETDDGEMNRLQRRLCREIPRVRRGKSARVRKK